MAVWFCLFMCRQIKHNLWSTLWSCSCCVSRWYFSFICTLELLFPSLWMDSHSQTGICFTWTTVTPIVVKSLKTGLGLFFLLSVCVFRKGESDSCSPCELLQFLQGGTSHNKQACLFYITCSYVFSTHTPLLTHPLKHEHSSVVW